MNKNIKRIIALTLTINAFSTISAITPGVALNFITKPVYASSYDPSSGELKSLTVKLVAEIDVLPNPIKTHGNDLYEVVEIVESNQKIKVVVLTDSFTSNDLFKLDDFRGYRIYFGK